MQPVSSLGHAQNLHTVITALYAGEDASVCSLRERESGAGGRGGERLKRVRELRDCSAYDHCALHII